MKYTDELAELKMTEKRRYAEFFYLMVLFITVCVAYIHTRPHNIKETIELVNRQGFLGRTSGYGQLIVFHIGINFLAFMLFGVAAYIRIRIADVFLWLDEIFRRIFSKIPDKFDLPCVILCMLLFTGLCSYLASFFIL